MKWGLNNSSRGNKHIWNTLREFFPKICENINIYILKCYLNFQSVSLKVFLFISKRRPRKSMTRRQKSTVQCWRNTSVCLRRRRSLTSWRLDVACGTSQPFSSASVLQHSPSAFSAAGGQSGWSCAAAFLRSFFGVRLQGAGGPREEDVWFCGACKFFQTENKI